MDNQSLAQHGKFDHDNTSKTYRLDRILLLQVNKDLWAENHVMQIVFDNMKDDEDVVDSNVEDGDVIIYLVVPGNILLFKAQYNCNILHIYNTTTIYCSVLYIVLIVKEVDTIALIISLLPAIYLQYIVPQPCYEGCKVTFVTSCVPVLHIIFVICVLEQSPVKYLSFGIVGIVSKIYWSRLERTV